MERIQEQVIRREIMKVLRHKGEIYACTTDQSLVELIGEDKWYFEVSPYISKALQDVLGNPNFFIGDHCTFSKILEYTAGFYKKPRYFIMINDTGETSKEHFKLLDKLVDLQLEMEEDGSPTSQYHASSVKELINEVVESWEEVE